MTDVLGVCTSWDDVGCTVQPETGAEVRIPLAEIVTGKPVPPRASVRARVSPKAAHVHGFALFPDLEVEPLGDWVLRRSPTATARRANSVLAFGPSGVADDVEAVVAHYDRPVAAVLPDSAEEQLFRDRGWDLESDDADTSFQVAGTATAMRALPTTSIEVELEESPGHVVARIDDRASGYAGTDGDWLGFGGLWVEPVGAPFRPRVRDHRRVPRLGRRPGRHHGVPPGAGRQHRRASALRPARLPRAPPLPLPRPFVVPSAADWLDHGRRADTRGVLFAEVRSGLAAFGDRMWNELRECALCGAAFVDAGKHQRFHDDLDAWIQLIEHELDANIRRRLRERAPTH